MHELTTNEIEQVNGGHPVIYVVSFVMKSTITRSLVKGAVAGVSGFLGYTASK